MKRKGTQSGGFQQFLKECVILTYFLLGGLLLPHSYDRSASFNRGRYGTEDFSVLHLILQYAVDLGERSRETPCISP